MPTLHPPDFMDAHRRCWEDAELLFENERWASADQMYGFSAECGLKAVMEGLGMLVGDDGKPEHRYRKHVQNLWPEFEDFASRLQGGTQYLKLLPEGQPFSDWSHDDRYANRDHVDKERVTSHRLAAQKIANMAERRLAD